MNYKSIIAGLLSLNWRHVLVDEKRALFGLVGYDDDSYYLMILTKIMV